MKKPNTALTCGVSLAALLASGGCSSVEVRDISYQPDRIDVYRGQEERVYHLTQEEGEKQLVELAKQGKQEDAWIFKHGENLWIDVGKRTYPGRKDKVSVDPNRALKFLTEGDEITFYHFHPWRRFETILFEERRKNMFINLPPEDDYAAHIYLKTEFPKMGVSVNPSRVAGALFTVSYDLDKLKNERELERELKSLADRTILNSWGDDLNKKVEDYIDKVKELGIDLKIINYNHPALIK
ncbi:hypothetical protein ACFLZ7_01560 [Nanoarchaeota archaeon]